MSELTEFLLARIGEDEREAKRDLEEFVRRHGVAELAWEGWGSAYCNPARVLAECEAKRDVVRVCTAELAGRDIEGAMSDGDDGPWLADHILHTLALPYADHPDYRQEWKP